MTKSVYSTGATVVDPVFFAVVPDSFMRGAAEDLSASRHSAPAGDWPEEVDRPLVSPHDRWSF